MTEWRTERTGWRDAELSKRHGYWGFNCPAVDLDFVMMEYNHGKPAAIVEYKHTSARPVDTNHATYRALVALADGYRDGPLPCFIARYDPEDWSFVVTTLNERAMEHYADVSGVAIPEQDFVRSLHLLRKSVLAVADETAIASLGSTMKTGNHTHERHIQNEILRTFATRPDMRLWRQNTGVARMGNRVVRFGVPGQADLTGILPGGVRLEIEVKSATGRQTDEQRNYQRIIERFGGVYVLARSVADVWAAIAPYLAAGSGATDQPDTIDTTPRRVHRPPPVRPTPAGVRDVRAM